MAATARTVTIAREVLDHHPQVPLGIEGGRREAVDLGHDVAGHGHSPDLPVTA